MSAENNVVWSRHFKKVTTHLTSKLSFCGRVKFRSVGDNVVSWRSDDSEVMWHSCHVGAPECTNKRPASFLSFTKMLHSLAAKVLFLTSQLSPAIAVTNRLFLL